MGSVTLEERGDRGSSGSFVAARPAAAPELPSTRIVGTRLLLRWPALFDAEERARRLIEHAFALDDVQAVGIRRERGEISVELAPLADVADAWRRLGGRLRQGGGEGQGRASGLDLDGPTPGLPVRVTRAGKALTTFQARTLSPEHLRIGHPQLRDRDSRLRFIDLLRAVHGVSEVRGIGLRAAVVVLYDPARVEPEQLLRLLERSWPAIVAGPPVAPRPVRLATAGALLALSSLAQFSRPVLLPWATAAVVLYSLPNLINGVRELARGRVGLYALYSVGLGFLLWTRLPFASSVMATLTQLWPALARGVVSDAERKLFAERRRRVAWARLSDAERGEIVVDLDAVTPGAAVLVRSGELVPVDGVVVEGRAAVDERALSGTRGATEKVPGDAVYAGTLVHDGSLTVQATRVGASTTLEALARALPRGDLGGLPSRAEVERIADRNAKPALAAAAILLAATRAPRLSQVVIRPDYATAPRLSAHLSALTALAEALDRGALVRRPAALDLLSSVEAFVFDDGADFAARTVAVTKLNVVRRSAAAETLGLAAAALAGRDDPRAEALARELQDLGFPEVGAHGRRQRAGDTVFWDDAGARVAVATPSRALEDAPAPGASPALDALVRRLAADHAGDPAARALVVMRDRRMLGVAQFAREGEPRFAQTIAALRARHPEVRFVRISSAPQDAAEAAAAGLGFDAVLGGLEADEKAHALRSLGLRTAWIGLGTDPGAAAPRAASLVSISLGGLDGLARDEADVVLLRDDLSLLGALRSAADAHAARLSADYRTVYLANTVAMAGGFAAGFGSLGAGLTSNLGSGLVLLRRWRELRGLSTPPERLAIKRDVSPRSSPSGSLRAAG